MSLGHLPPRLSDAEALALGRLIEPELHAALVTVDAHGADMRDCSAQVRAEQLVPLSFDSNGRVQWGRPR